MGLLRLELGLGEVAMHEISSRPDILVSIAAKLVSLY